jgi:protein disulfide-isomerase
MTRKTVAGLLLVAAFGMVSCTAKEGEKQAVSPVDTGSKWMTSLDEAKASSVSRKVPILVNFSGSDWCMWCIRLDKEVFSTKTFKDYADQNLVLLSIDFPRTKTQSDALRAQGEALASQFKIEGLPTVILMDATGRELARTGYQAGGAAGYVDHLKGLLKK